MAFKLNSKIQLGDYSLKGGVNEIVVKRSVNSYMDTATIKIPALGRVLQNDALPQSSVESAKQFKEGDRVVIHLGYNGELVREFDGFIRRVSPAIPVVLECEGFGWQLRRKRFLISWKSTTLLEVLQHLVKDTDVKLSGFIPTVKLTNFALRNVNGLEVLDYFKKKMLLTAYFNFNELYVGLQQGVLKETVSLRLGWNVLRDDQLKYRLADDTRVLVRLVTGKGKKNKRLLYEVGDKDGVLREITIPNITDQSWLQRTAADALAKAKFTGYEGSITCFLQPFIEPSCVAKIIDKKYNRGGSYMVMSTEVSYGMNGARRKIEIGRSL
ncbi:hypothetical protein [Pedobacter sp. SL55]|uniref:hypothetical protein n=1 Tax=Pedobacter sp. SL55 TaxID=2995161 RepID=UPI00226F9285|nr:hypothetical protein [Pedobacter sp. SL55]WAC40587.1 hypothetical protein OVA16_18780 [Pedobacter sp. SL55]